MLYVSGNAKTRKVKVNGKLLDPAHSLKVFNHSPDGFAWGYEGSGSAQLALALLLLGTDDVNAQKLHQAFKEEYIVKLSKDKNFTKKISLGKWIRAHGVKYVENVKDLIEWNATTDAIGRACGSFCRTAEGPDCNCSCGGVNHGKDRIITPVK